jgi:hypothetical protein
VSGDFAAFLCYARFDDEHDDGQLSMFRDRLAAEVRAQTGRREFVIFQDRASIGWGENWRARVEETLDAVSLLLVVVTPGLFGSAECRGEVARFAARERKLGRSDLILPVYYISAREMEDPAVREGDEIAALLAGRQFADWRDLRFEPLSSPLSRKAIAALASRLRDTFWLSAGAPAGQSPDSRGRFVPAVRGLASNPDDDRPAITTVTPPFRNLTLPQDHTSALLADAESIARTVADPAEHVMAVRKNSEVTAEQNLVRAPPLPTQSVTSAPWAAAFHSDTLSAKGGFGGSGLTRRSVFSSDGVPSTMLAAILLMYVGAAASLVTTVVSLSVTSSQWWSDYPVSIIMWIFLARESTNGWKPAQAVGSVLFGIATLILSGEATSPQSGIATICDVVVWLVGLGAVICLWRPASSAFFLGLREHRRLPPRGPYGPW